MSIISICPMNGGVEFNYALNDILPAGSVHLREGGVNTIATVD